VCHIAIPSKSLRALKRALKEHPADPLSARLREDLATNISVSEQEGTTSTTEPA
jgi:hypothetical protein